MTDELKRKLVMRLRQAGAYDVKVADPGKGYEHALPEYHPLKLYPECKSVVVFAVACNARANNTYFGPLAPYESKNRNVGPVPKYFRSEEYAPDRLQRLFVASLTLKGMTLLSENGSGVSFAQPQFKLSAYEAGLGVYGRSGVILHPVLGNRIRLGVIMTDREMEPDPKPADYAPCAGCDLCLKACPAKAFDESKVYPHSYSMEKCTAKRAEIEEKKFYCHNCWAVCPAGKIEDGELLITREAVSFYKPHQSVLY